MTVQFFPLTIYISFIRSQMWFPKALPVNYLCKIAQSEYFPQGIQPATWSTSSLETYKFKTFKKHAAISIIIFMQNIIQDTTSPKVTSG